MIVIPRHSQILLGATVFYAVALFYWLSLEDVDLNGVTAIGIGGALVVTAHVLRVRWGGHGLASRRAVMFFGAVGLLVGALSALLTMLLMVTKIGLHAHAHPDFTAIQMSGVLRVAPVWVLAGGLLGTALGVILAAHSAPDTHDDGESSRIPP